MFDGLFDRLRAAVTDLTPDEAAQAVELFREIDISLPPEWPLRVRSLVFSMLMVLCRYGLREARTMNELGVDLNARESPTIREHLRAEIEAWNAKHPAQDEPGRGAEDPPT